MTFQSQMVTDLDKTVFLPKPNGFADEIVFTPENGTPVDTVSLVNFEENQKEDNRGNHSVGKFLLKRSDVGNPVKGDVITLDLVDYDVIRIIGRDELTVRVLARGELRGSYKK